jgi:GrpB-like predicted nucleotidyltransferase (UPF0157 family)
MQHSMEAPSEIVDYDDEWPALFETIKGRIAPALEELGASVEHVGSTAVPGLAAKPIVDIDVVGKSRHRYERRVSAPRGTWKCDSG